MSKKTLSVDVAVAEFMLDLPEGTTILSANVNDGKLVLEVDSDFDFPEVGTLVYESDDYGNVALTGAK